ncbi:MAG: M23 family metallopeptidase [Paracoccaceae bacterium]
MKTLHRLFLSTSPITAKQQADRERAAKYLSIPGVLTVKNSYRTVPDMLDHLVLESDDDIDEASLRAYIAEPGFHNIHLVLTDKQWTQLGLRSTLYGQARVVGGQIITYGAWDDRRGILSKYDKDIQKHFTENTLGEWHELDHGVRNIFGVKIPTTHAVFYGYRSADIALSTSRRWVRKPYPLAAWRVLPWHLLPDQTPKRVTMLETIARLQAKVLGLAKSVLEGIIPPAPAQLFHPVPREYRKYITQPYGVKNKRYKGTGHHIGADYATPEGTPVIAPTDGEVVQAGYSNALGFYLVYAFSWLGKQNQLRALHLKQAARLGRFKGGAAIGYTGNTGDSDGPHLHGDLWRDAVRISGINSQNFRERTIDPELFFNQAT